MLAMILIAPPYASQIEISILNTRFRRCAFMPLGAAHGDMLLCKRSLAPVISRLTLLPRFNGVTRARCLLFDANMP
jgi:hypothetical protein